MFRTLLIVLCLTPGVGCSSLGISLFPAGHHLTKQAEEVLRRSPNAPALPRELHRTVIPVHYLEPGDTLLIETVKLDSDVRLPADQQVMTDGSIDLGGYGRVVVAGLTLEDAEGLVEQALLDEGEEKTAINIRLLDAMHRFYVLGEVNSPGSYPLTGFESVLDGILAAGGLTSDAAQCKILLARPTPSHASRVTLPICYREIAQMGDTSTNYQLQPGDRIYVASRSFFDELMFWTATDTCDRCCKRQSPSSNPESVNTVTPVMPGLIGVPMARESYVTQELHSSTSLPTEAPVYSETYAGPALDAEGEQLPSPRGTEDPQARELESSRIFVPRSSKTRAPFDAPLAAPSKASSADALKRESKGQLDFAEPMKLPGDEP